MIEYSTRNRIGLKNHFKSLGRRPGITACPERRFIYMKPAKTGGTSIYRHTLQKLIPGMLDVKTTPSEFQEWLDDVTDKELEDYFIFSVVRNPWDRMVSVAAYFDIPFRKLTENIEAYRQDEDIEIHTRPLYFYSHFENKPYVDMVCRFESLQPDFNLVCDRIDLSRTPLPHSNKSRHDHYSKYYDPETKNLVQELFSEDIKYYGYSFENSEQKAGFKFKLGRFFKH